MTARSPEEVAKAIVDTMRGCQTNHPDKWLPVIAQALRAARAEGARDGIERSANYIENLGRVLVRDELASVSRDHFDQWAEAIRALKEQA